MIQSKNKVHLSCETSLFQSMIVLLRSITNVIYRSKFTW